MPARRKLPEKKSKSFSFFDHLEELRKRILFIVFSTILTSLVIFTLFNDLKIYDFFLKPLFSLNQKIYYYNLIEPFIVRVKISFILAALINTPVIIFQIVQFSFPALKHKEKNIFIILLFLITLFFSSGVLFSYKVLLPNSINFLIKFAPDTIKPVLRLKEYIELYLSLTFASGLIFLFPILISFLTKMGVVDYRFLIKHMRESIVGILIISAIITPPDVFSQLLLSLPLFILYLISLLFSFLIRH
ncbi:MAG: twin-arginine translocase subunit TatC [Spirochaetes bacterium]|nr:twin-arginine translocase subunit TatC [Spirochaetota bacterium]